MKLSRIIPFLNRDDAVRNALVEKATQQAESGRRLVMFDRESGLYAFWYITQRFEQESDRSQRYNRPLSVILVEAKLDRTHRNQDEVQEWLLQSLRTTDLTTHLGDGRYLALLIETEIEDAATLAARIAERFSNNVAIGLAGCPKDGVTLEQIQASAERRLNDNWAIAV